MTGVSGSPDVASPASTVPAQWEIDHLTSAAQQRRATDAENARSNAGRRTGRGERVDHAADMRLDGNNADELAARTDEVIAGGDLSGRRS
eukprot:4261175-Prymnesium_polylepis.1